MTANGSGARRAAGVASGGVGAAAASTGAAVEAAAARGLAAGRGFAVRLDPVLAAVRVAAGFADAFDDDEDDDAPALAARDEPPLFAALAVDPDALERDLAFFAGGASESELAVADARARERAGVSAEAAASGAGDGAAAPPDAGPARLALRRAGRVRGRLFRTSRSSFFGEPSLGGMARLLPIHSRGA